MAKWIMALIFLVALPGNPQEGHRKPSPFPEKNREREAKAEASARAGGRPPPARSSRAAAAAGAATGKACFFSAKAENPAAPGGEDVEPREFEAAHTTYPLGSVVSVTNLANGKSVRVRIVERFSDPRRIISVSEAAAKELGFYAAGTADVKLDPVRLGTAPAMR